MRGVPGEASVTDRLPGDAVDGVKGSRVPGAGTMVSTTRVARSSNRVAGDAVRMRIPDRTLLRSARDRAVRVEACAAVRARMPVEDGLAGCHHEPMAVAGLLATLVLSVLSIASAEQLATLISGVDCPEGNGILDGCVNSRDAMLRLRDWDLCEGCDPNLPPWVVMMCGAIVGGFVLVQIVQTLEF